jgi:hypothetical protein
VNARSSGTSRVYSLTGQRLPDPPAPLTVIGWSSDSRSLFVFSKNDFPLKVQRLDLATGVLAPWKEIMPTDIAGALDKYMCITPDGNAYAYSVERMMTDLYIVDGLR